MKLLFALFSLLPLQALAGADCPVYPKSEWASEDTLKQALNEEGYTIKKFKVDANCYEIYGRNKQGKKVEIYFDTKTLAIIKAEVEK
ncbi:PepSY domain-containing protein [Methylotenera sp. G11]|uniref:PepSY domain-containing protein n=1 Tax=Methylotenera sp. G11 TaxID=1506585 RepID=UPI0006462213|nr:PepSY domain-containing protein [Methylotenera sp. G11]